MFHAGARQTAPEMPEPKAIDAQPRVSSRRSPTEAASLPQDRVRRGSPPEFTQKERVSGVADVEATMSPDRAALGQSSGGTHTPGLAEPRREVRTQDPPSSATTGDRVPGRPNHARPVSPTLARRQEDVSSGQQGGGTEHEATSTIEVRTTITPSEPLAEGTPVPARGEPPATRRNAEPTARAAQIPKGRRRRAGRLRRSIEDDSNEERSVERQVEQPLVRLPSLGEPGAIDAPSPVVQEDNFADPSSSEATIRVTIGRIDVRAVPPPTPPQRRVERQAPRLSLDDYLRSQSGGAP